MKHLSKVSVNLVNYTIVNLKTLHNYFGTEPAPAPAALAPPALPQL